VVAFPGAGTTPAPPSDFFLVEADSQDIRVPSHPAEWLTLSPAVRIADGLSQVDYRAADNTLSVRHVDVRVQVRQQHYAVRFSQQPGELVQTEMTRTLNCPLNLDCLIAVCFIASLINEIPIPPIKYLVAILAILAIVVLSLVVIAIRHAFFTVPEPKPLSTDTNGVPIIVFPGMTVAHGLPLANIAAEDQVIALQTIKEIYWLLKQTE
jgi:hypothetical protein